ncbi:hypothetical protein R3P38DRAFT_2785933 [Favolaschia claudopus]|uniref:Uncharacterized protein n=1 Tax=Favolaschia claudopus TaxID=2862362 RepID=A0AAW0AS48_9AGAR
MYCQQMFQGCCFSGSHQTEWALSPVPRARTAQLEPQTGLFVSVSRGVSVEGSLDFSAIFLRTLLEMDKERITVFKEFKELTVCFQFVVMVGELLNLPTAPRISGGAGGERGWRTSCQVKICSAGHWHQRAVPPESTSSTYWRNTCTAQTSLRGKVEPFCFEDLDETSSGWRQEFATGSAISGEKLWFMLPLGGGGESRADELMEAGGEK